MAEMQQRRKRRGSFLDIIIIVLVVLLIVGAYVKFFHQDKTSTTVQTQTISYTVLFESLEQELIDNLQVGDAMYSATSGNYIGVITEVTTDTAYEIMKDLEGAIVQAPLENRYDAYVTIQTDASESGGTWYAEKTFELIRNSAQTFTTKYFKYEGKVVSIAE